MTDASGPAAALIEVFWWITVGTFGIVFVATMTAVVLACRNRPDRDVSDAPRGSEADRRAARAVSAGVAATVAILLAYLVGDLMTQRALARTHTAGDVLTIAVTAHQWWWEVEYVDSLPARRFRTANEIHIPTGRPVRLMLESVDVIHSLWIPSLQGKKDMIPARPTELWLQADRPGLHVGRCAEFCGHQHAKMALDVVAESPADFQAWYDRQLEPADPPTDALTAQGLEVLLTNPCVTCHAVRGTPAGGHTLAGRRHLAAGTIPNNRGYLAGWLLDPQRIKPGVHMPANVLTGPELDALLAYLESLR